MGVRAGRALRQQNSYAILRIPKNPSARENPQIMKKTILQTLRSFNANPRNQMNHAPPPGRSLLILLVIACFALSPQTQAVEPAAPETALPGGNTADGQSALASLTTGQYNSAFGFLSLIALTDGSFNTGVGAGTLLVNNGTSNTAIGAGALFTNSPGGNNTAIGTFAMFSGVNAIGATAIGVNALQNDDVGSNTATGFNALLANTTGFNNAAYGVRPLESNVDGINNTAIGNLALQSNVSTIDHVAVGRLAGSGITTANNNVIVGHHSGVHSVFGQISDRCHIDNIFGAPVSAGTAAFVFVDSDGRLGTTTVNGADPGGFFTQPAQRIAPQSAKPDTVLNGKVEKLQATVAQQEKQIDILTTQLKEQAAQIQKVSAQLEVKKPAAQVVSYDR